MRDFHRAFVLTVLEFEDEFIETVEELVTDEEQPLDEYVGYTLYLSQDVKNEQKFFYKLCEKTLKNESDINPSKVAMHTAFIQVGVNHLEEMGQIQEAITENLEETE